MTKVAFFAHDARDAAVQRRIGSFMAAGAQVVGFTMRRGEAIETPWNNVDLGETRDAAFLQRLVTMAKALPALAKHRAGLAGADILYARNLDMLVLAQFARWRAASQAKVVYECLDVHRLLAGTSMLGSVLRAIERLLLRKTALVVVSSPAFVREYFELRHPGRYRALLLENRLPEGYDYGPRPDRGAVADTTGVIRIGWFGNLRCRRSLGILLKAADRLPDRVRIVLRGLPTTVDLPDFHARIAGRDNVEFGGRYYWPQDLPDLYKAVDLVWAGDFHDAGANSAWLLPNRLYEGGYYGTPPLAPIACETGRWVEAKRFGFTLAEPLEETVPEFLASIDAKAINEARDRLLAAPRDQFVQPLEQVKELLDAMLVHEETSVR